MIFRDAAVAGAYTVEPELVEDERGFFARIAGAHDFAEHGLEASVAETSISYNRRRWTLRGLHYQLPPHEETKLIRCTRGAVYDVIVDLRRDSPTFLGWEAVELSAENRLGLYVPRGCAHGYLTLEDESELLYQISEPYAPGYAAGVRWDDPLFEIQWPATPRVVSVRDASYPDFVPPVVEGGGETRALRGRPRS
jgi:dTDP-4-dehydrorhamnose 3,5-epimerase